MNTQEIKKLKNLLSSAKQITIIPHKNPDGDAMGSCLALFHFLKLKGLKAKVISPTRFPSFLRWLPGSEEVLVASEKYMSSSRWIKGSDIIFTLDFNNLKRADILEEFLQKSLQKSLVKFVMIDHHQAPDDYAKVTISESNCSSTCELLYQVLDALGAKTYINEDIATCLYTGIMTDTGCFKYSLTTAETFKTAGFLVERGADPYHINSMVFDSYTLNRLGLLSRALSNLTILNEKTAYTFLTCEDLKEFKVEKGYTEGIVNYALKIKTIDFAAFFVEEQDTKTIKISFRSKKETDVNEFARNHFQGGGHINAAGGFSALSLEETIEKFKEIVSQNQ